MDRLFNVLPSKVEHGADPYLAYLIITPEWVIADDGAISIALDCAAVASNLHHLAKTKGSFAILNGRDFLYSVSTIHKIDKMFFDEDRKNLIILAQGKTAKLKFPVDFDIDELPHVAIEWDTLKELPKVSIRAMYNDVLQFISQSTEASVWGDILGVYGFGNKLISFDYQTILVADRNKNKPKVNEKEYFVPLSLLQIGIGDMDYARFGDEGDVYITGTTANYYTNQVANYDVLKERMTTLARVQKHGKRYSFRFNALTSDIWRRAKHFSDVTCCMTIKDGKVYFVSADGEAWIERVAKTDAPNCRLFVDISLLQPWATYVLEHELVEYDGMWVMMGMTRNKTRFYSLITGEDLQQTSPPKLTAKRKTKKEKETDEGPPTISATLFN